MSRLLLVGTGLIGGSFATAAKRQGLFAETVGSDSNSEALHAAIELGICDRAVVADDEVSAVCIAVPTKAIAGCVKQVVERYGDAVPIMDVGSVKGAILRGLDPTPSNFVPCHPIAGSHLSGPGAASADLFENRTIVLTPVDGTSRKHLDVVRSWWEAIDSTVREMTPEEHDQIFAVTSHLPHLLSYALMEQAEQSGIDLDVMTGGGFRDLTRLSAADADVWTDIFGDNAENLQQSWTQFKLVCESLLDMNDKDVVGLRERLSRIRNARSDVRE